MNKQMFLRRYGLPLSTAVVAGLLLPALLLASSAQSAGGYSSGLADSAAGSSAYQSRSVGLSLYFIPTTWTLSFEAPIHEMVALAVYNGKLYAGGVDFGQSNGRLYVYDGNDWTDTNFSSEVGDTVDWVQSLLVFNGRLYIGTRVDVDGSKFVRVYYYDGATFTADLSRPGQGGMSGIEALAVHDNTLYAANGSSIGEVYQRDGDNNWTTLGAPIEAGSPVRALASYDGSLYAGTGVWSEAKVWRWTGATWVLIKNLSSDFGVYDGVQSLASANGNLYAGLTLSGSVFVYDGINWSVSISIPGSSCARLAVIGHTLWAGTCGGDVYLLDGGIWTPVGSTGEGYVSDFVQYDGFVYAATCYNGRIYRTTAPTPFLDLPFEYGGSVQAFRQALLDTDDDDKGRVDSWFDHEYPYGWGNANNRTNGSLLLYDGKRRDKNPSHGTLGCYEERCYDGHDGIDFAHLSGDPPDLPIHPAARGEVVEFEDSCFKGQTYCGDGFGNYVIVDHQNGYFTLYAHLKEVLVGIQSVTADTILGTMGATGNVVGADGTHLHFGVYRDDGDGVWEGRSQDKPVDPYGWNEDEGGTDPWVEAGGEASYSLWIHEPCPSETVSGSQGAVITDTTGDVQATIPADAFTGSATFELSPGPVAGASAQLLSSVRSFWLRLLEWLQEGSGLQSATTLQSTTQLTLTKPITLTVTYTDTDVLHLDVSQLALHRWDEEQEMWQPLTTTLDLVNHVITAQTEDLGDFDLQAPLLCATDDLEPDDGYAAARWVWPNDWPLARGLDIPQDSDWSRFDAIQGVTYTISTQNLAVGADTVLNLYDVDALTLLANNDDGDGGPASELVWTAPYTGTFFVETVSAPGGTTDCSATYELTIVTIPGDVIADCRVDIADIMQVAIRWRLSAANPDPDNDPTTPNYETLFDLDRDGDIDIVDIMRVAAQWGETCW